MDEIMGMTGFQSPCAEYAEKGLSLDEKIITHKNATYFIRAGSVSKTLKIEKGDLLVIDRSLHASENDIVFAVYNGQFIITKFIKIEGRIQLYPWKRMVGDSEEFKIEGVVKAVVREFRK